MPIEMNQPGRVTCLTHTNDEPFLSERLAIHVEQQHNNQDDNEPRVHHLCEWMLCSLYDRSLKLSQSSEKCIDFNLDAEDVFLGLASDKMFVVCTPPYLIYVHCETSKQWNCWTRSLRSLLLKLHSNRVNARNNIGHEHMIIRGTLHSCAVLADECTLSKLLQSSPSLNQTDDAGDTALHLAVLFEHPKIVCALLNAGADAALPNAKGIASVQLAVDIQCQHTLIALLCDSLQQLVLESLVDDCGRSLLWRALLTHTSTSYYTHNHYDAPNSIVDSIASDEAIGIVIKTLCGHGMNPNDMDKSSGFTALCYACIDCRPHLVASLLEAGADPNAGTPLHTAVRRNDIATVQLLLSAGASPNARSSTPLCSTPLHEANTDELAHLLLIHGARASLTDTEGTLASTQFSDDACIQAEQAYQALDNVVLTHTAVGVEWMHDSASTCCLCCADRFSAFVRKHHCRRCARLVCRKCSTKRMLILDEAHRLCDGCFNALRYTNDDNYSSINSVHTPTYNLAPHIHGVAGKKRDYCTEIDVLRQQLYLSLCNSNTADVSIWSRVSDRSEKPSSSKTTIKQIITHKQIPPGFSHHSFNVVEGEIDVSERR